MTRNKGTLRVSWAPDVLKTFAEVLLEPGYYFNAVSGDLYRHEHHPEATERYVGAIQQAADEGRASVETRIWLKVTDDVSLTDATVRAMLRDGFGVRTKAPGRPVSRTGRRRR